MRRTIRWTASGCLVAVVVTAVAVLLLPRVFGWTPYVVTSGSMQPTFHPGDVVLTAPVPGRELAVGDVVTFRTADGVTTHRVVGTQAVPGGTQLQTQGDANDAVDAEPLDVRNVLGEVRFGVPLVGHLVAWLRTPAVMLVLAALFALTWLPSRRPVEEPAAGELVAS